MKTLKVALTALFIFILFALMLGLFNNCSVNIYMDGSGMTNNITVQEPIDY